MNYLKSFKKKAGYAGLFIAAGLGGVLIFPQLAMAEGPGSSGWDAKDMIDNAYKNTTKMTSSNFDGATVAGWVSSITTWILGIAIACFVLKVVLTAIAKMLHSEGSSGTAATPYGNKSDYQKGTSSPLCNIPIVGAYDPAMEWKTIFIHFGKQVGVVAGAWIIIQIIVNIVLFVLNQVTTGSGVTSGTGGAAGGAA